MEHKSSTIVDHWVGIREVRGLVSTRVGDIVGKWVEVGMGSGVRMYTYRKKGDISNGGK